MADLNLTLFVWFAKYRLQTDEMSIRAFVAGVTTAGIAWYTLSHSRTYLEALQTTLVPYEETLPGSVPSKVDMFSKYGLPRNSQQYVFHKNHVVCYDRQRRIPLWVAEHVTKENLKGCANRKHSKFLPDPSVPIMFSAQNDDYHKSGWSRGHMAPAGDNKYDQEAMSATFYLSNILPQNVDNNNGFWNRLEMYCRDLAAKFDHVWIVSGPLFLPETNAHSSGKKFVRYEVIGKNEVAVPTHLFKVVVAEKEGTGKPLLGVFVVPNVPIPSHHQLHEFKVDLEFVESHSGLQLLPLLAQSKPRDLCALNGCKLPAAFVSGG